MATKPTFIETDANKIISELVAAYEASTGKTLQPAQPERLVLNATSYRELLVRQSAQNAALQNLVEFSSAPVLDYLGELVGVKRLAAASASTNIQFTLVVGHGTLTIPQGTRVASVDGKHVFATVEDAIVLSGDLTATVVAECQTAGIEANGYLAGQITTILDPQPYLVSATNTNTTEGGANEETDENLRERIRLAPASFSNAGSTGAYKYWAKTANANIIDVGIVQPEPGTVAIYPLMADGSTTPSQVVDAVYAVCSAEKVRPLTDTVLVIPPTRVDYDIVAQLTLYTDAIQSTVVSQVQANLNAFTTSKRLKMGLDIIVNQIIQECMVDGVYTVAIQNIGGDPLVDLIVSETEFAFCSSIEIHVIGTTNG